MRVEHYDSISAPWCTVSLVRYMYVTCLANTQLVSINEVFLKLQCNFNCLWHQARKKQDHLQRQGHGDWRKGLKPAAPYQGCAYLCARYLRNC